jgi:hypothetical protein
MQRREEHAPADKKIAHNFGVRCQNISQDQVAESSILGKRNVAKAYSTQSGKKTVTPVSGELSNRENEDDGKK